jgi:uncharacterized repeat protein (TIGR01451 family)
MSFGFPPKTNSRASKGAATTTRNAVLISAAGLLIFTACCNTYVTAETRSTDFPNAKPPQATNHGSNDAFVAQISLGADLAITSSAPASVTGGSTLTYTIVVNNLGPDMASKVTIRDATPVGTSFNNVSISTGSCTTPALGNTGTVTCTALSLASGGTITETLTVNVVAASGSRITDTASVSSSTFDPNSKNNSAKAVTRVT